MSNVITGTCYAALAHSHRGGHSKFRRTSLAADLDTAAVRQPTRSAVRASLALPIPASRYSNLPIAFRRWLSWKPVRSIWCSSVRSTSLSTCMLVRAMQGWTRAFRSAAVTCWNAKRPLQSLGEPMPLPSVVYPALSLFMLRMRYAGNTLALRSAPRAVRAGMRSAPSPRLRLGRVAPDTSSPASRYPSAVVVRYPSAVFISSAVSPERSCCVHVRLFVSVWVRHLSSGSTQPDRVARLLR